LKKKSRAPGEYQKRMDTITGIINKTIFITLWGIGLILLLGQMGVNIGPILTAAGVFGLALSFGAQSLVKDIINGIFIIIENQIRVGDVAVINGTGGLVEAINLRTVVMRDLGGVVHIFPNGSIDSLSNLTKEWSGYVYEIGVAYKENIDRVIKTIHEVGESLKNDKEFGEKMIDDIEVFGLDKFANSALVIKGRIRTEPLKQWAVGREFNRRIKKTFDKKGIEIPFPHQSIYFGSKSDPIEVLLKNADNLHK
jgi:small-conductance mechanosensitive channel